MEFDLATGIISVIITATSAVTIYLIAEMSRKGPTYDDVKASHRQERHLHHNHADNKADSKRQKKLKKKVKAAKTSPVPEETNSEDPLTSNSILTDDNLKESDHHSEDGLEPEIEAQVVEIKTIPKPSKNKSKSSRKSKSKTEVSKTEVDQFEQKKAVLEESEPEAKPEVIQNQPRSQQSFKVNLKSLTESVSEPFLKTVMHNDKGEKNEVPIRPESEEKMVDLEDGANATSSKLKKKVKKKKIDDVFNANVKSKGVVALNHLLPLIREAELSHSELQILIDSLLNQENDSEWYQGKQDPMLKLKKQLSEMEKNLSDDVDTINGLQAKLSTIRNELNNEKSCNKTLHETLSKTRSELMVFSHKCQQVSEENQALVAQINQMQQQIEQHQMIISKCEEEKVLQQQMHIPHEQHHEAVLALQGQVNHLASQLQEQQSMNASLSVQLQESIRIQEEFRSMHAELDMLLNSSQYDNQNLNSRLQSMSKEMEDARSKIADLTSRIDILETGKNDLKRKNEQLEVEISQLTQTNKMQKIDAVDSSTEGSKNNGSVNFMETDHSSCLSRLEDKETVINNLNSELNQKALLLEKLTNDIINSKNESNKKQTQIENLNVEITSLKTINNKVTSDINSERIMISELRTILSEKTEELSILSKEIETSRLKNNELRNKNWKLVEALSQAETSLKEVSLKLEEAAQVINESMFLKEQIETIGCKLKIPLSFSAIKDNQAWLSAFESELTKVVSLLENKGEDEKMSQLVDRNEKLNIMVIRYKEIIADLEVMLHELENKIQSEEEKQHKTSRSS